MHVELYLRTTTSRQRFGPCLTGYFRGDIITFAIGVDELSEAIIWVKGKLSEEEFVSRTTFNVCRILSSVEITSERKIAYRLTSHGKIFAGFPELIMNKSVDYVRIS